MSIERTNRLKVALQKAKANLPSHEYSASENRSRLGRLLDKPSTLETDRSLLANQPIPERPIIDAISKETFGEDVEYIPKLNLRKENVAQSHAEIVALRLKNMRERVRIEPETPLGTRVGFSVDGKPLWASIIDEPVSYTHLTLPTKA